MKKSLFFLLLIVSFTGYAQDLSRVREVIDTLCSPYFFGRGYVKDGDAKTAAYLVDKYRTVGLKAYPKGYNQPFKFPVNTFPGKVWLRVNRKTMAPGHDFILESSSPSGKKSLNTFILDTLIFTNEVARNKFLKQKGRKKALVYKAKDLHKIAELPEAVLQKIDEFEARVELHKKLTASVANSQSKVIVFQILEDKFPSRSKKISFEVEAKFLENHEAVNVVGFLSGESVPDSVILISAHYDHLGGLGENTYFPGANDNASGVSMLLELADHYRKSSDNKYTIVFIAFAAEEAGLIGSRYFVENPLFDLSKIKFLLNLDLNGTGDDGIAVVNANFHEKEFSLLAQVNEEQKGFGYIKKRGEAANSDHYFFHKRGVRSFFVYTLGGISAYHDVNDIAETLPLTKYKELFGLLTGFIDKL